MRNARSLPPRAALLLLVAASFSRLGWGAAPARAQDLPEPTQNAAAGSRVFGARGCGECHAVRGLGGGSAPDLARPGGPRSLYDLTAALWNHVPRMAGAGGRAPTWMSPREAANLAAFLYTVDYFDPPGDAVRGRALFFEKRCVMCHQAGGVGGVIGPSLDFLGRYRSPIPVAAAMWNHGSAMAEEMRRRGIERPAFTGRELLDLIAFLEGVSPRPATEAMSVLPGVAAVGRELYIEKQCARCHGPSGGGGIGPSLVQRAAGGGLVDFAAAMWNKAPAMIREMRARGISQPELDGAEMAHIVAWLYSIRYFAEAGSAARGRALLEEKGCRRCHATGGAAPPLEAGAYRSPSQVAAALANHTGVADRGAGWPALSGREAADLTAWLLEGRR